MALTQYLLASRKQMLNISERHFDHVSQEFPVRMLFEHC